jgi:hypothetical protein
MAQVPKEVLVDLLRATKRQMSGMQKDVNYQSGFSYIPLERRGNYWVEE